MAKDWEALAGETGRPVSTSRFGRAVKLGSLATKVTGSAIARRLKKVVPGNHGGLESHLRHADLIVQTMGELKGAAMKVGQMLSADPDLVPAGLAERLASLQRSAPPMDYNTVRRVIETALDRPIDSLFRYFDPEPIGSASIGQVHRATRFDGRQVAIKVQYPGIGDTLESDLRNLKSLFLLGRIVASRERLDAMFDELHRALLEESDYAKEGHNLARFATLFADREGVRAPAPHLDLTARTVLTMDFVSGRKLDVALEAVDDLSTRDAVAHRFIETFVWMFHDQFLLHADPHPGNFLLADDGDIVFLDFGCIREFEPAFADGVLRLLVALWANDMPQLEAIYRELRFGDPGVRYPEHDVLRTYHQLVLEPLYRDTPFNFGSWTVHGRIRQYVRQHPALLKMIPPAESIMYLRVVAGLKGLLTRLDTTINVREMAEITARQRGFMPARGER